MVVKIKNKMKNTDVNTKKQYHHLYVIVILGIMINTFSAIMKKINNSNV
jgi:hypothetical protein